MTYFIVRHGIAEDLGEGGASSDADRRLTDEGRRKTGEVALGLKALHCRPDRVVSSPLVRARETAEILAGVLAPKAARETAEALVPGTPPRAVLTWLRRHKAEQVLLVGHMPDVAELTGLLIGAGGELSVRFKKAGAACVSAEGPPAPGSGVLEWLATPRMLIRLGREAPPLRADGEASAR